GRGRASRKPPERIARAFRASCSGRGASASLGKAKQGRTSEFGEFGKLSPKRPFVAYLPAMTRSPGLPAVATALGPERLRHRRLLCPQWRIDRRSGAALRRGRAADKGRDVIDAP